jgi:hypothetical protein
VGRVGGVLGPVPASGGIRLVRRLGAEPMRELFARGARSVTPGEFLGRWRLMSIDGMEWDVSDTPANAAFFEYIGG